jgi:hypothetical protein
MKINLEKGSEYGNFSIEPTAGKQILAVYFDFSTKLLIVEELVNAEQNRESRPLHVTTIDAGTARIISLDERKKHIDYSEGREIDEELGLKRIFRREINFETGNEFIIEKLSKLESNAEISSATRTAFGKTAPATVFDDYKARLAQKEREELFWKTEYAAKDFEERAAYWASAMLRQMRWQSESGLDEYAAFTPGWYEFAKNREPDFDKMLTFIFERYRYEFNYQDASETEIRRRIGKKWQNRLP